MDDVVETLNGLINLAGADVLLTAGGADFVDKPRRLLDVGHKLSSQAEQLQASIAFFRIGEEAKAAAPVKRESRPPKRRPVSKSHESNGFTISNGRSDDLDVESVALLRPLSDLPH